MSGCMLYHWGSVAHPVFQYIFETIMGCLVPFTLINTCYSSVICRLRSAMFQRKGQSSRLILLIISAFAVFWLPYHIVNIIEVCYLFNAGLTASKLSLTVRPRRKHFRHMLHFSSYSSKIFVMLPQE